ncbi:acetyltransferase AtfA [Mycolicibacterium mageritense DSM 44476 = CIP 104973]|uniref:Acyltransferase n=1 Tax=Mycolicibacterium mageritense TaxID=53462 RepID=A0ABM7HR94_MYCME|nr:acyltransferase [Mycolicibacterium mageritense]OKH78598.1 acyltransferase [Mycobacterium sp. SWH-M3]MCC9185010.1 acyltransferase [Mycolicibacterium mageritense]TXI56208.1 MAG: acyltransferase [Mycolicibacterium mageritense]CDO21496.1 acetyltransferase AtfA [Mycolicibacterium mageritense DSM 44476 = CIP 104973]BBX33060.1 acyltransferase [Mycolicibacterium mageritense]
MKLAQAFDPRNNALNAFRLALAAEVILWHSFPVTGRMPPEAILQVLFSVGVDGFFAISGFLITRSWLTNPNIREYLMARALRILPGFYVCLAVTAFVIAPIAVAVQGGSVSKLLTSSAPIEYIVKNIGLIPLQRDIGGTPHGIPDAAAGWNASLWSLIWEVACYLIVALIGVVGLASRRWVSPVFLVLATAGAMLFPPLTYPGVWTIPQLIMRTGIMFAAGALMYHWRDVIPARWSIVAVCVVIVFAAGLLPDYRVVAGLPLAYAVIVSGALIRNKRMTLRTDLSYGVYIYAFPMQQLLAIFGLVFLSPILFFVLSTLATLPFAAMSWFLVEKRAMALKARYKRRVEARAAKTVAPEPKAREPQAPEPQAG